MSVFSSDMFNSLTLMVIPAIFGFIMPDYFVLPIYQASYLFAYSFFSVEKFTVILMTLLFKVISPFVCY